MYWLRKQHSVTSGTISTRFFSHFLNFKKITNYSSEINICGKIASIQQLLRFDYFVLRFNESIALWVIRTCATVVNFETLMKLLEFLN